MSLDLGPLEPVSREQLEPKYESLDPATDLRRIYAGSEWSTPGPARPIRTASGEWMVPVILDLPYAMLASLEAEAQSREIGHLIRAALVAAGHGVGDDIVGVRWSRFATLEERQADADSAALQQQTTA